MSHYEQDLSLSSYDLTCVQCIFMNALKKHELFVYYCCLKMNKLKRNWAGYQVVNNPYGIMQNVSMFLMFLNSIRVYLVGDEHELCQEKVS